MKIVINIGLLFILNWCYSQNLDKAESLISGLDALNHGKELFDAYRKISHQHPDPQIALEYSNKAYDLALSLDRQDYQAFALEEMGLNQRLLGNKVEAMNASLSALRIYETLGLKKEQAAIYVQLGSNAVVDQTYDLAISYFLKSSKIYEFMKDSVSRTNYALTNVNLGEAYRLNDNLDSAIFWFRKSITDFEQVTINIDKPIVEAYSTGNLGMTYNMLDSLDLARNHLTRAINLTRELGDPYTTSVYLADLGLVEQKEGNLIQAESNLLEAFEMAKREGLKEQIRDISQMLVNLYEIERNFQNALNYQKIFQQFQDSLVNRENVQQLERLKANYEIDKRESEIDLLSQINVQQRLLSIGLGTGLLLLLGFSWIIYRTNGKLKLSNTVVMRREQEKVVLLHELNHRVKNNLQMISSLFSLQEGQLKDHPAKAAVSAGKYRVKALSLIHRSLYQKDHHTSIELQEYMEELVLNLCHGFGFSWKPKLELDAIQIHIDRAVPLALIINELVTNALKYAYKDIEKPKLWVRAFTFKNQIIIEVKDNGVGLGTKDNKSIGFGSKLVHSLIQQIDGNLELLDGPGTHWRISLSLETSS